MRIIFFLLAFSLSLSASESKIDKTRHVLIGFDNSKIKTPTELIKAIRYTRLRLNMNACSKVQGSAMIETLNHLNDYPNSEHYHGFQIIRFEERPDEVSKCDTDHKRTFQDIANNGAIVVALGDRAVIEAPQEVTVPINQETLKCGHHPHFPTNDSLNFDGRYYAGPAFGDECKTVNELLEKAKSQGGSLAGALKVDTKQQIQFTNLLHPVGDVKLYWKRVTVTRFELSVEGKLFRTSHTEAEIIPHG